MSVLALVAGRLLTMAGRAPAIDDAVIIVEDEHLAAVGPAATTPVPRGATVVDLTGCAVIPGLVNTHTHIPQILLRGGASSDRSLLEWLFTALYPGLAQYSAEDIRCAYRLYALEALRSGVTTMLAHDHVDAFDYVRAARPAIESLEASGIRTLYGRMFSDQQPAGAHDGALEAAFARWPGVRRAFVRRPTEAVLADLHRLLQTYDGRAQGRIRVIPSPSTASAVSLEALMASDRMARERTGLWTLHVSETASDRPDGRLTAVRWLAAQGLLSPRLVAGHCVHVDKDELGLLASNDVAISTQPVSNGVLGSGTAPVSRMLATGLRVGLGTDDANCNDTVDPLSDLKTLAVLQRAVEQDVSAVDAWSLLEMATIGGARVLGLDSITGSVEVGKRADLAVIDMRAAHLTPSRDLAATLVYQASGSDVRHVLIDGEFVLRDRQATFLAGEGPHAEAGLLVEASERSACILAAAGL